MYYHVLLTQEKTVFAISISFVHNIYALNIYSLAQTKWLLCKKRFLILKQVYNIINNENKLNHFIIS